MRRWERVYNGQPWQKFYRNGEERELLPYNQRIVKRENVKIQKSKHSRRTGKTRKFLQSYDACQNTRTGTWRWPQRTSSQNIAKWCLSTESEAGTVETLHSPCGALFTICGTPRWATHICCNAKRFVLATHDRWFLSDGKQGRKHARVATNFQNKTAFSPVPRINTLQSFRYELASDDMMHSVL